MTKFQGFNKLSQRPKANHILVRTTSIFLLISSSLKNPNKQIDHYSSKLITTHTQPSIWKTTLNNDIPVLGLFSSVGIFPQRNAGKTIS